MVPKATRVGPLTGCCCVCAANRAMADFRLPRGPASASKGAMIWYRHKATDCASSCDMLHLLSSRRSVRQCLLPPTRLPCRKSVVRRVAQAPLTCGGEDLKGARQSRQPTFGSLLGQAEAKPVVKQSPVMFESAHD